MRTFKIGLVLGALAMSLSMIGGIALAQFPNQHSDSTVEMPGVVGGSAAPHAGAPQMMVVQAPAAAVAQPSGGIIQLSAFGWLQPYVDSLVQALLLAGVSWVLKSKYTAWMDQSARDALGSFTKNVASSLIADGFVRMSGKTIQVSDAALANEVNTAADRIPGAMKRFGLTPGVLAQKIVDAIPQTPAGAAIVATAHAPPDDPPLADPVQSATPPRKGVTIMSGGNEPPTASS